ncbi:MAG TPA: YgjP-like metallopeptidase domain-containing protein [Prolixibacteraceae bacterium]
MNEKTMYVSGIGEVQMVRRARSKKLRIAVKSSGAVVVSIPWQSTFSKGESFLEEKKNWVIQTKQKLEKQGLTRTPLQPGELFSTRSLKYFLLPMKTERVKVFFKQDEHIVEIGYPENESLEEPLFRDMIRFSIDGVLRYEARRYLPARTMELADKLGYSFKSITLKNNKTNWGSCSGLKNINLNIHLIRLPDRMIDLILVHELVHTKIPNHGPLFKEQLKRHFPDVEELNRVIKQFSPELF